jgi:hypothetical protein
MDCHQFCHHRPLLPSSLAIHPPYKKAQVLLKALKSTLRFAERFMYKRQMSGFRRYSNSGLRWNILDRHGSTIITEVTSFFFLWSGGTMICYTN